MASLHMISQGLFRSIWGILAVWKSASKTSNVSDLMLSSKRVGIKPNCGTWTIPQSACICRRSKVALEKLKVFSQTPAYESWRSKISIACWYDSSNAEIPSLARLAVGDGPDLPRVIPVSYKAPGLCTKFLVLALHSSRKGKSTTALAVLGTPHGNELDENVA